MNQQTKHDKLAAQIRAAYAGTPIAPIRTQLADLDVDGNALGARVVETAGTDREDLALLGLLLRGVRDD